jgi:hypothetical protein
MNAAFGFGLIQSGLGMWGQMQQRKNEIDAYNRQVETQRKLAGRALAVTYNSIYNQAMEVNKAYQQQAFDVRVKARQVAGQAIVQQAATGAAGKRVQLATAQATEGAADRALGRLQRDRKFNLDALIQKGDMEAESIVNRLITSAPDLPAEFDPLTGLIGGAASIGGAYLKGKEYSDHLDNLAASDLNSYATNGRSWSRR